MCDFWRELARLITFFDENSRHMWRVQHVALKTPKRMNGAVCPAKAGVFSGSESHRGKSQTPRSLDSSQEGNRLV